MSVFIPNTRIDVWRTPDTTVDDYGDQHDDETLLYANLPAYLVEQSQRSYDPASGTSTLIEVYTLRVRPSHAGVELAFTEGDRIKDREDDEVYTVDQVSQAHGVVGKNDLVMNLWHRK